jgi:hypothetical protein
MSTITSTQSMAALSFYLECDPKEQCKHQKKFMRFKQDIDQNLRTKFVAEKKLEDNKSSYQKFLDYGLNASLAFAAGAIFNGMTGGTPLAGALFSTLPGVLMGVVKEDNELPSIEKLKAFKPILLTFIGNASALAATFAGLNTCLDKQNLSGYSLLANATLGVAILSLSALVQRYVMQTEIKNMHEELHLQAHVNETIKKRKLGQRIC